MFGLKKQPTLNTPDTAVNIDRALKSSRNRTKRKTSHSIAQIKLLLNSLEACFYVIDQIKDYLTAAAQIVLLAKDTDEVASRALLAEQYDQHRLTINAVLEGADNEAKTLLNGANKPLTVQLTSRGVYAVMPVCLAIDKDGLDLPPPALAFECHHEIAEVLAKLDQAFAKLDDISNDFMQDARFLISRLERQEKQ